MNLKNEPIFLAGHNGLVGSSVLNLLKKKGYKKIEIISKNNLNLTDQEKVLKYIRRIKPSNIIICAAKVGGIKENMLYPADFIYQNSMIQNNIIHAAHLTGVKNLIFLGSSCIYPKYSNQPIKEIELLNGKLETTNQSYAIAKIAGIEMCRAYNKQFKTNYKCLMPSNLYGPKDNYNLRSSHFFAAAIRKIYEAKVNKKSKVTFWGTGQPKREALFVYDLAEAIIFFLNKRVKQNLINIGSGYELSIKQYVKQISKVLDYKGLIIFNNVKKLDGTPRKVVNNNLAKKFGWKSKYNFNEGIKITIDDFVKNKKFYLREK